MFPSGNGGGCLEIKQRVMIYKHELKTNMAHIARWVVYDATRAFWDAKWDSDSCQRRGENSSYNERWGVKIGCYCCAVFVVLISSASFSVEFCAIQHRQATVYYTCFYIAWSLLKTMCILLLSTLKQHVAIHFWVFVLTWGGVPDGFNIPEGRRKAPF